MYKFSYEEAMNDSGMKQRENERLAIEQSIALLRQAEAKGAGSREAVEAIFYLNRLWSFLLEHLARADNALPEDIRAKIISVGIWLLREADAISKGKSKNFAGLIEISAVIAEGL
jgi:flagellar protein FlaF